MIVIRFGQGLPSPRPSPKGRGSNDRRAEIGGHRRRRRHRRGLRVLSFAARMAVTLVDQGAFGRGCSHANCGYVCPSHVLPMAAPGAVTMGLKALVARNSPLKIHPRLDPALWSWLWQFSRCCNARQMLAAGKAIQALLASSRELYDELLATERIECEWEAKGLLFVFQSAAAFEHYATTDELMRREFGIRARRLAAGELVAFEPALKADLPGAWHYETDAHLRPDRLMAELKRVLVARGVAIREHCAAKSLVREHRLFRAIEAANGRSMPTP